MRQILSFVLIAILLAACRPATDTSVRITGVVQNPTGDPIELVYFSDFTNNQREIVTLELDAENRFDVSFDIPTPMAVTLRNGRVSLQLFLQPGDRVQLEADATDWLNTLALTGEAAPNSTFFVQYQRELGVNLGSAFFNNAAMVSAPVVFQGVIDSVLAVQLGYLETYTNKAELSEPFNTFFTAEMEYAAKNRLLAYPSTHQRLNQLPDPLTLPDGFFDFLNDPGIFNDNLLHSEAYANFLLAYLGYQAGLTPQRFAEGTSQNEINYTLAGELIPGESGAFAQVISINREFNFGSIEKAQALYDDFVARDISEDLRTRVTRTWEGIQALMPGKPAPDFTLTDINGNEVSLSDFKGKVVYLKFWASWCGPCMRQVPPAAELKKRLADQEDLVFLYVSIDTDNNAWRSTVEHHGITGTHLVTPGRERGAPDLYQVKWIPTFYIIGRDGNIFDNRPPQPSDPRVDEVLLKALAT
ncbi:MAG TPA: TlpA disulfide reductase family protein [Bacteroidales bacterium]|nr:TlpA disulfide reductase family protein [Bacteroidales bacterium]